MSADSQRFHGDAPISATLRPHNHSERPFLVDSTRQAPLPASISMFANYFFRSRIGEAPSRVQSPFPRLDGALSESQSASSTPCTASLWGMLPLRQYVRPSEIENDFRVGGRTFPRGLGNSRDSRFLRKTVIPEKRWDSSSLIGTSLLGPPQAEIFRD